MQTYTPENPPACYLSTSEGLWRLIYQGMPLCADTPERARAEACARQMKVKPAALWDGEKSRFETLEA